MIFQTKFGENRSRPLIFRLIKFFKFFISRYQILKFRCIHEASLVRKPKSSNIPSRKKNFVKSVRKQYGNPDSHVFFVLSSRSFRILTYIFRTRSNVSFNFFLLSLRTFSLRGGGCMTLYSVKKDSKNF